MKICKVCLESNILCSACNKKVETGEVKKLEVDLSRAIYKINKEKKFDIDFLFAESSEDKIFVVAESQYIAKFIGPGGRNIKRLSELIGRQIKLLEKSDGNEKTVIEKLIGVPLLGLNKIYFGKESYKLRIEKKYMKNVQPFSSIIGKILGKEIIIVFE